MRTERRAAEEAEEEFRISFDKAKVLLHCTWLGTDPGAGLASSRVLVGGGVERLMSR